MLAVTPYPIDCLPAHILQDIHDVYRHRRPTVKLVKAQSIVGCVSHQVREQTVSRRNECGTSIPAKSLETYCRTCSTYRTLPQGLTGA